MTNDQQVDKLITDVLRALGYTLRRECLRAMASGARSPSQIAEATGEPLGVVAYHIRVLYRYKLIKRDGNRRVRGAIEHYYKLANGTMALLDALENYIREAKY